MTTKRTTLATVFALLMVLLAACGGPDPMSYAVDIQGMLSDYVIAINNVSAQIDRAVADSNQFADAGWQQDLFAALDELDTAGNALGSYPDANVPEDFAEAHGYLKQIGAETAELTSALRSAVENQDIDAFNAGQNELQDVLDLLNQANAALEAIQ